MLILANSGIYKIKSKIDARYYPGSTRNVLKRKECHFSSLKLNKHHCQHLQRFYNKYGADALEFVIIKNNIPEDQLLIEEQKLLDIARTEPEKCFTSNFIAGKIEMTLEVRKKLSFNHIGEKNPMFGKTGANHPLFGKSVPVKRKEKISQTLTGRYRGIHSPHFGKHHSLQTKQKISKSKIGTILSPEHRAKISQRTKGANHPFYNHTIYKFQDKITNEIFEGTQYHFRTKYNLNRHSVGDVIRGKQKSVKNWILIKTMLV